MYVCIVQNDGLVVFFFVLFFWYVMQKLKDK